MQSRFSLHLALNTMNWAGQIEDWSIHRMRARKANFLWDISKWHVNPSLRMIVAMSFYSNLGFSFFVFFWVLFPLLIFYPHVVVYKQQDNNKLYFSPENFSWWPLPSPFSFPVPAQSRTMSQSSLVLNCDFLTIISGQYITTELFSSRRGGKRFWDQYTLKSWKITQNSNMELWLPWNEF